MCGVVVGAAALVGVSSFAGPIPGALAADGAPDPAPPGVASLNPALAPFENQPVRWHECRTGPNDAIGSYLDAAGAQCAGISVPLDYARPDGREITLGVSRIRAADTAHRRGILMINLGGPGGPALDAAPDLRGLLGEAADGFDVVGMDPRFVGRSAPLDCGPLLKRPWPRAGGPDQDSFDRTADGQAAIAQACAVHADVLPFASTRNTARDMDIVRAALDERKSTTARRRPTSWRWVCGPSPTRRMAVRRRRTPTSTSSWTVSRPAVRRCPAGHPGAGWRRCRRGREAPTRVANTVPALVVAAEKDNRTPYAGSRVLHRALSSSRLVTLRGARVHGVYGGRSGCVDEAVNAYLRSGTLPSADLTCTRPPAPPGSLPE
ncbi:hypothetical protein BBK14_17905 [Parafrankia soli]|uniref:Peptidase S33 tripeptidyl aminopeptidase-like C-terminal domain-containing protein n=1 Tax=Parafrankia soli TaxID=2599596 RepID=A0A1S1Q0S9_9ACTN|nr:alpha/beta hydrolase [Parafrankia soli]OHV28513.1 hypothetical protein BBK14_17905 [Parafrankia soli]